MVGVAAAELAADQRCAARLPVWIEQERLLVRRRVQQLTVGRRVKLAGQFDQPPFGERPNGYAEVKPAAARGAVGLDVAPVGAVRLSRRWKAVEWPYRNPCAQWCRGLRL